MSKTSLQPSIDGNPVHCFVATVGAEIVDYAVGAHVEQRKIASYTS